MQQIRNKKTILCSDFNYNFFHTFQHILRKKIIENFSFYTRIFFTGNYFFNFLEFSETYADPCLSDIREKLNYSSKLFVEKSRSSRNIKWKFSWTIKIGNCFCVRLRTLHILSNQKLNLDTLEGVGMGMQINLYLFACNFWISWTSYIRYLRFYIRSYAWVYTHPALIGPKTCMHVHWRG